MVHVPSAGDAQQTSADSHPTEPLLSRGANLRTAPKLLDILAKADDYLADGNDRIACKLWQAALPESHSVLCSEDGQTYFPLSETIEKKLAGLPAASLRSYRISADASAKGLLAQTKGNNELSVLSQIVEQFFLSSEGDDAAFRLSCLHLDRFDFTSAVRLLNKIVTRYPDPSVDLAQVWLRLAVAYAYLGRHLGFARVAQTSQNSRRHRLRSLASKPPQNRLPSTQLAASIQHKK